MAVTPYSFRVSALDSKLVLIAADEGLLVMRDFTPRTIPWSKFQRVALWYAPNRFDRQRYCCRLFIEDEKPLTITSTHYLGVGNFEPQPREYVAFIRAMHQQLLARNPGVKYESGVGGIRYVINLISLIFALSMLFFALMIVGLAMLGPLAIVQLIVMIVGLPYAWKWLRRNGPKKYDPHQIPAGILPVVTSDTPSSSLPPPAPIAGPGPGNAAAAPVNNSAASAVAPVIITLDPTPQIMAAMNAKPLPPGVRRYTPEDFGPIAEPGDHSWCSVAGSTTHWADAERYAAEANAKLEAGLIGPPDDRPNMGEQPL